jgi:hypothetical protein
VIKTGEMLDTKYEVIPSPHKEMPKEVTDQLAKMNVKMDALLEGKNPFGDDSGETVPPSDDDVSEMV